MTVFQLKLMRDGPAARRNLPASPMGMASILSHPRYVDLPQDAGWRALKDGSRPTMAVLWTLPCPCYQRAMPG